MRISSLALEEGEHSKSRAREAGNGKREAGCTVRAGEALCFSRKI